jgi:pyruvate/2-oxoglutarate dehydrogenase complex dihydrolipoamide acyltransferase (E2) component
LAPATKPRPAKAAKSATRRTVQKAEVKTVLISPRSRRLKLKKGVDTAKVTDNKEPRRLKFKIT